jgi:hypothetical protein
MTLKLRASNQSAHRPVRNILVFVGVALLAGCASKPSAALWRVDFPDGTAEYIWSYDGRGATLLKATPGAQRVTP